MREKYIEQIAAGANPITLTEQKFRDAAAGTIPLRLGIRDCPLCLSSKEDCSDCPIYRYTGDSCYTHPLFIGLLELYNGASLGENGCLMPDTKLVRHIIDAIIPALQELKRWADKEKFYE